MFIIGRINIVILGVHINENKLNESNTANAQNTYINLQLRKAI